MQQRSSQVREELIVFILTLEILLLEFGGVDLHHTKADSSQDFRHKTGLHLLRYQRCSMMTQHVYPQFKYNHRGLLEVKREELTHGGQQLGPRLLPLLRQQNLQVIPSQPVEDLYETIEILGLLREGRGTLDGGTPGQDGGPQGEKLVIVGSIDRGGFARRDATKTVADILEEKRANITTVFELENSSAPPAEMCISMYRPQTNPVAPGWRTNQRQVPTQTHTSPASIPVVHGSLRGSPGMQAGLDAGIYLGRNVRPRREDFVSRMG